MSTDTLIDTVDPTLKPVLGEIRSICWLPYQLIVLSDTWSTDALSTRDPHRLQISANMYQNKIFFERTQRLLMVLFEVQFTYNFALNKSYKKAIKVW